MRYHIDTIPVWDAAKLDGECLFCALRRRTELGEAERYLGASVMEPDTRIQVNEKGFCTKHHKMLYGMSNRLGHALMLESHVAETRKKLAESAKRLKKAAAAVGEAKLLDRMKGKNPAMKTLETELAALRASVNSCIMCDSIRENMERYTHTFFHLYENDTEFRTKFAESKGVCLDHFAVLMETAAETLKPKAFAAFAELLCDLETMHMDRMQEDISWFIKKFDYRYDKEPWKNSKDAVERTVNKLRGWCVGEEPNPKD